MYTSNNKQCEDCKDLGIATIGKTVWIEKLGIWLCEDHYYQYLSDLKVEKEGLK